MAEATCEPLVNQCSEPFKPLLQKLPHCSYGGLFELYQWEGIWCPPLHLEAAQAVQQHFEARDDDVILASAMKTGTTWLKALVVCIMRRPQTSLGDEEDPLVKNHPAFYVQTLETQTYVANPGPDLSAFQSPRTFHTHLPYSVLPDSIKNSGCKIVYIVRDPKDTVVSMWHFMNILKPHPFEIAFENFSNGTIPFVPFFDHVLLYWNQGLKQPEKILFLEYEELKREPNEQVKKLAAFLGRPFDNDEEVENVVQRCSLERLKNLEVNKSGVDRWVSLPKSSFFRLGIVGDWKKKLTPGMRERVDQIVQTKLEGSGLEI